MISDKEKSEPRSVQAFNNRIHFIPHSISLPPLIFKFYFLQYFGLYSQAETTSVTTKTSTKILREGGVHLENVCSKI